MQFLELTSGILLVFEFGATDDLRAGYIYIPDRCSMLSCWLVVCVGCYIHDVDLICACFYRGVGYSMVPWCLQVRWYFLAYPYPAYWHIVRLALDVGSQFLFRWLLSHWFVGNEASQSRGLLWVSSCGGCVRYPSAAPKINAVLCKGGK